MLSDEEKQTIEELKNKKADYFMISNLTGKTLLNLIEKQSKEIEHQKEKRENQKKELAILNAKQIEFNKLVNTVNSYKGQFKRQQKEIEELKASHITTNNKATNTEKAKIFDVIENSIDTYIEKSKPYWEQIMTKDEMTIDEALTIIDDMYQDRYKIMSQKTDRETIVDLGKMDYIKFTNLEWASVRALREVQSLNHKLEKLQDKIKAKIEELENYYRELYKQDNSPNEFLIGQDCLSKLSILQEVKQSLLEKE